MTQPIVAHVGSGQYFLLVGPIVLDANLTTVDRTPGVLYGRVIPLQVQRYQNVAIGMPPCDIVIIPIEDVYGGYRNYPRQPR